jgi:hypothetical protein
MRHLVLVGLFFASFRAAAAPAMLLPVDAEGLSPDVAAKIDAAVRAAVGAAGIEVQSADATRDLMQDAYAGGLSCRYADLGCATRFGQIASAPAVLVATVVSPPLTLRLSRVDLVSKDTVTSIGHFSGPDDADSLTAIARTLANGPARLVLKVAPVGASVSVDGVDAGKAPLAPLAVAFGPHEIKVALDGFTPQTRSIVVAGSAPTEAAVQLDPATSPLLVGGTTTFIAGALVGIGFGVATMLTEADLATPKANHGAGYADEENLGKLLFGATVVGGIVAVTGATLMGISFAQ